MLHKIENLQLDYCSATGCLLIVLAVMIGCNGSPRSSGGPFANYKDMAFFGNSELSIFITAAYEGIAEVYIELPDGSRHFLPNLAQDSVRRHLDLQNMIDPQNSRVYSDGFSRIEYKDEKLSSVTISAGSEAWKVSATEEGPYFDLPISKADLVSHFGEPDSWGTYEPLRGP